MHRTSSLVRLSVTPVSQKTTTKALDQLSIDTLRLLAVDAVEKANSGHPGAPLGCAPMAYLLFHKLMKHNPAHSKWADRDRFVLSNGHASALLYCDAVSFRLRCDAGRSEELPAVGIADAGHPERGDTDGVEVTTGPLGQGMAMAVGMAMAEKHLAAVYNRPGFEVVDHHTYAMLGDGDLMEGVSPRGGVAGRNAGAGQADLSLRRQPDFAGWADESELIPRMSLKRFEAYHWHVQRVADGNDLAAIEAAIEAAKAETGRPSMIAVRTVIGYGSPRRAATRRMASRWARRAWRRPRNSSAFLRTRAFTFPMRRWRIGARPVERGARQEAEWKKLFAELRGSVSGAGGGV